MLLPKQARYRAAPLPDAREPLGSAPFLRKPLFHRLTHSENLPGSRRGACASRLRRGTGIRCRVRIVMVAGRRRSFDGGVVLTVGW